jgi:hypothetical protein
MTYKRHDMNGDQERNERTLYDSIESRKREQEEKEVRTILNSLLDSMMKMSQERDEYEEDDEQEEDTGESFRFMALSSEPYFKVCMNQVEEFPADLIEVDAQLALSTNQALKEFIENIEEIEIDIDLEIDLDDHETVIMKRNLNAIKYSLCDLLERWNRKIREFYERGME